MNTFGWIECICVVSLGFHSQMKNMSQNKQIIFCFLKSVRSWNVLYCTVLYFVTQSQQEKKLIERHKYVTLSQNDGNELRNVTWQSKHLRYVIKWLVSLQSDILHESKYQVNLSRFHFLSNRSKVIEKNKNSRPKMKTTHITWILYVHVVGHGLTGWLVARSVRVVRIWTLLEFIAHVRSDNTHTTTHATFD